MRVEGSATLGGIYNNANVQDTAKLQEYQDLSNGALSNVGVRGRNSTTWFDGYGENFGRTDQFMFLRGGMYDIFKAGAYLNEMPHTFNSSATHAVRRQRQQPADGDVPAVQPGHLEFLQRWATSARTPAATSSGRRTARGTSGSTATR